MCERSLGASMIPEQYLDAQCGVDVAFLDLLHLLLYHRHLRDHGVVLTLVLHANLLNHIDRVEALRELRVLPRVPRPYRFRVCKNLPGFSG